MGMVEDIRSLGRQMPPAPADAQTGRYASRAPLGRQWRDQVRAAQISAAFDADGAASYLPLFVLMVIQLFHFNVVPVWAGGLLLGLYVLMKVASEQLRYAFRRASPGPDEIALWERRYTWISGFAGLIWGTVGFVYYGAGDVGQQSLLSLLLMGVMAASVLTLMSNPSSFYVFIAGLSLPLLTQFALQNDARSWVLFGICVAFLGALSLWGRMLHRRERESLELAFMNASLREQLEQSREEAYAARDQAQEGYLQTSQLLDNAQRLAGLGSWDFNPVTGSMFWSEHYRRMLEYPPEVEPSFAAMKARIHPDDWPALAAVVDGARRSGEWFQLDFRLVTPRAGTRHVVERCEAQLGDDGRPRRISAVVQDVSDRRHAELAQKRGEEYLRAVLESVSDIIAIIAPDGRVSFTNHAVEAVLGYRAEDVLGHSVLDMVHEDDKAAAARALLDGRMPYDPANPAVLRLKAHDGSYRDIEFIGRDLSANPLVGGTVVLARDISLRRRAERQLHQAKEEAEMASMAKSHFLANMSHELRTPLNAILGFSELIESEALGPLENASYKEYIGDIRRSGSHLLALINDILDLSRIEAGRETLREQELDLGRALEGCVRLIAPRRDEAGIEIVLDIAGSTPSLWVDRRKFNQIVINLLSNAVKFTPAGGTVTLSYAPTEDGGVAISVRDTGIGMRPEDIPTAMQPFSQIDNSATRRYEGAGLGLTICQALVRLHDGRLTIDSAPGKGTTVTVELPPDRVHRPVSGAAMGAMLQAVRQLPPRES